MLRTLFENPERRMNCAGVAQGVRVLRVGVCVGCEELWRASMDKGVGTSRVSLVGSGTGVAGVSGGGVRVQETLS